MQSDRLYAIPGLHPPMSGSGTSVSVDHSDRI